MMIRNATKKDIPEMMKLIHQAQSYFKRNHIDQWQDGYPNEQQLLNDILKKHSYVLDNGYIMGTMYFAVENDLTYEKIDGQWKTDHQSYAVIHRIVIDENLKGQNLAKEMLLFAQHQCNKKNIQSIRIDTHQDNLSMQSFLNKNGFEYCGHIFLENGSPRIAFEKLLNKNK